MKLGHLFSKVALLLLPLHTDALALSGKPHQFIVPEKRAPLQNIITWDEDSLFVHGKRIMFYGGEFHPFRLPVPSLWLDVFQKIKALGYNGVSFYSAWTLHEGKQGSFSAEGVFAWEPFFDAAKKAGVYLIARPGPYINAEVSGGGFPGFLQRVRSNLRTPDEDYQEASRNYIESITRIIAKAQITNGGPVILFQPENEYTLGADSIVFPDADYMNGLMQQFRDLGIVVPFINNVAFPNGVNAPGTDAPVDIYGHDAYPLGFDCANPSRWPDNAIPTNWRDLHMEQSPNTPYMLVEFQGGAFDPWGGNGFEKCAALLNHEFERVFYKNNFGVGCTIFNVYMPFGGSNWGNLGHPGGYSSYDYGAVITDEAKLMANFLQVSPAYLTAEPGRNTSGLYTDTNAITVTPLIGNKTNFYVTRQTRYNSLDSTSYKLRLQTNYDVGGFNVLYSSAEIFTWKKYGSRTVVVVYGGPNELHELAVSNTSGGTAVEGSGVKFSNRNGNTILNWETGSTRRVVRVGQDLYIVILDRNSVYSHWVVSTLPEGSYTHDSTASSDLIVKAGYLIRTAEISSGTIALTGDINATTEIEIIGGGHENINSFTFNGEKLQHTKDRIGFIKATVPFKAPEVKLPDLSSLSWKYTDSLPEIRNSYSDAAWTDADHAEPSNTYWNLTTPTVLWGGEYGYHTGSLITRGHFTANGDESSLLLNVSGGSAFGFSAWVNETYLGSWPGYDLYSIANITFTLPNLISGKKYVLTILSDHMGYFGNWFPGYNEMKTPRGVIGYELQGHDAADVKWKITGNLGGENFKDRVQGPLNEGGMWAERQGYHLPSPPMKDWEDSKGPTAGISKAGVGFFTTSFNLDMPKGYDIPLSFVFANSTSGTSGSAVLAYRCQLFVNGYQFGEYINNIGPQTSFPVPEGILNYHGTNFVAVSLWGLEAEGARVEGLKLVHGPIIQTGSWERREDAY
ncbi:glycoside hydrolase family 35 protein [Zopfia rhizophila CBS 207.26]|uniref:Beta-galactosidase n=1 Tax=Zopfia rhizophila CBS 207.26 TaxID=1314779 RepID=A0A6A6ESV9_9PEZI|nr:glycoside hydrolase family 35 protein [Zopfia rhizophila CBS 207.26]